MKPFLLRLLKEPWEVSYRLFQCFFFWGQPAPKGNLRDAQLIVVQSASDCKDGRSSSTNFDLANLAQSIHETFGTPIFPQAEVGKILSRRNISILGTTVVCSEIPITDPRYPGSQGIAQQQKELCDERGWTRVVLVDFLPHAWRTCWIYERLGLEVIIPQGLPGMKFQLDLAQLRWRQAITAYPYEFLMRLVSLIWWGVI